LGSVVKYHEKFNNNLEKKMNTMFLTKEWSTRCFDFRCIHIFIPFGIVKNICQRGGW